MVKHQHCDYAKFEPMYPELFRRLRSAGWRPDRHVDLPDEDELEGGVVRLIYAEDFLHSFHGLEVSNRWRGGTARLSLRPGKNWGHLTYAEDYLGHAEMFARQTGVGAGVYPVLEFLDFVGFISEEGRAFAVEHTFQRYASTEDIFQLMEWALQMRECVSTRMDWALGKRKNGVEVGYLPRRYVPRDHENQYWDRPYEHYPPLYRAFASTEGTQNQYILEEFPGNPKVLWIRVSEPVESGPDLFATYYTNYPLMPEDIARHIILVKLLDEFFEGSYRQRIERIHLKSEKTGEETTMVWPGPLSD